ncbi:MAG: hypothetical protein M1114_01395, partial [Candidatus Dependentiae bacterium]|nr:hypothetical protein [Candidatus Dependentiae bacterium]
AMENFEVNKAIIPTASKLGALSVINKNGRLDYSIADRSVQRCDIYGPLKEISSEEQLSGFLANGGKIKLSKMSNGEYALRSGVDIKGGGPILAAIGYWGVKALGYGVPATAAVLTVTAVAPIIPIGASGVTAVTTGQVLATSTGALVGTATTGSSIAVGAGAAGASTVGTVCAAAGSATGVYVAAVEGTATLVGATLLAVPFL